MSDNPAAFDALRRVAYDFVKLHGKDPASLQAACRDFMRLRKVDSSIGDISNSEEKRLIDAVVRWTIRKYNPPKKRPERHREERAATMVLAPELLAVAAELHGKSSVRNAARVSGQSKSTVARHLARQGISPRRESKISQLPANAQRLLRILDETFDRRAEGVLRVAELLEAIWEAPASGLPRSTLASRRKALGTMLTVVANSNLGYHTVTKGDFVAVRRGRNFRSLSEAVVRIEDDCRKNRFVSVVVPRAVDKTFFWDDPYILHMLEILEMSATEHFYPPERLNSIFFFKRPLIDLSPLLPWLHRARFSDYSSSMGYNLALLGDRILDPTVRRAASQVSLQLQKLASYCGPFRACADAFDMVDFVLDVMAHAKEQAPESFCRLSYLRGSLDNREETYEELREELRGMLALEQSGEWQAPNEQTLWSYLTAY